MTGRWREDGGNRGPAKLGREEGTCQIRKQAGDLPIQEAQRGPAKLGGRKGTCHIRKQRGGPAIFGSREEDLPY